MDDLNVTYKVRVRAAVPDPYAGMRGHDYIAARGLSPKFLGEQRHQCQTCAQAELLPVVLNIINGWKQ